MSVVPLQHGVRMRDDQATRLRAMLTGNEAVVDAAPMQIEQPRPKLITLASGKGGVGKTFTSISLAAAFAASGRRTTLIDADFGAANADIMLGLAPLRRLDECFIKGFARGHTLRDISIDSGAGFRLVPGPVGMGRPPATADRQRLLSGLSSLNDSSDLALLDCSAGVGPSVLDLLDASDLAVVVLTPEPTSIADAYALVKSLVRSKGPESASNLWLLVNQAGSKAEAERVHRRVSAVAKRFLGLALPLIGSIPHDKAVKRGICEQRIVQGGKLKSASGRAARRIADQLLAQSESAVFDRHKNCADPNSAATSPRLGFALDR
ncbi:MAG: MinD/ParA family protein [Phycisphaerales bacterium]